MSRSRCGEPNPAAGEGPQHERRTIVPGVSLFGRHGVAMCGWATRKNRRFPAPKGPKQISPGQRPGFVIRRYSVALKGHNGLAASAVCAAPSGLGQRVADPTQGVALGWYVAAPSGREEKDATIERVCRATRGRSNCRDHLAHGLTLLELVVVLSILAVLALVAVKSLEPVADQARYEATQRTLTNIEEAILGSPDMRQPDGTPLISGFVADMGRLPRAYGADPGIQLAELWNNDKDLNGVADLPLFDIRSPASDSEVLVPGGWRSPYLRLPIGMGEIRDGWGNPLVLLDSEGDVAAVGAEIDRVGSLGADNAIGGVGYDADLEVRLAGNLQIDVSGHVYELNDGEREKPALDKVTVKLYRFDAASGAVSEETRKSDTIPPLLDPAQSLSLTFSFTTTAGPRFLRAYLDADGNGTAEKKSNLVRVQRSDVYDLDLVSVP